MNKAEDLHKLVRSLRPFEKRYIRLQSDFQKGETSYMAVIDELGRQKTYSRDALMEHLIKKNVITAEEDDKFRAVLSYTRTCVLKMLRQIPPKKSDPYLDLQRHCQNAQILKERGLTEQSLSELALAKKIAQDYGFSLMDLKISRMEINLRHQELSKQNIRAIYDLYEEQEEYFDTLHIEKMYAKWYHRIVIHYKKYGRMAYRSPEAQELIKIKDHPKFCEEVASVNFRTKQLYLMTLGYWSLIQNRVEEALVSLSGAITLWKHNEKQKKAYPDRYYGLVANYLQLSLSLGCFNSRFYEYLEVIRTQPTKKLEDKARLFRDYTFIKLRYCLLKAKFEPCEKIIGNVEWGLKKFKSYIDSGRVMALLSNVVAYYFVQEDYKKATNWVLKMEAECDKTDQRIDLQLRLRLYYLIFDFEENKHHFLYERLQSLSRHVSYKKQRTDFIHLLIKHFKKILESHGKTKQDQREAWEKAKADVTRLKEKYQSEKRSASGIGLDEFELWLDSKIQKKSIKEVYENQVRPPKLVAASA